MSFNSNLFRRRFTTTEGMAPKMSVFLVERLKLTIDFPKFWTLRREFRFRDYFWERFPILENMTNVWPLKRLFLPVLT